MMMKQACLSILQIYRIHDDQNGDKFDVYLKRKHNVYKVLETCQQPLERDKCK